MDTDTDHPPPTLPGCVCMLMLAGSSHCCAVGHTLTLSPEQVTANCCILLFRSHSPSRLANFASMCWKRHGSAAMSWPWKVQQRLPCPHEPSRVSSDPLRSSSHDAKHQKTTAYKASTSPLLTPSSLSLGLLGSFEPPLEYIALLWHATLALTTLVLQAAGTNAGRVAGRCACGRVCSQERRQLLRGSPKLSSSSTCSRRGTHACLVLLYMCPCVTQRQLWTASISQQPRPAPMLSNLDLHAPHSGG